MPHPLEDLNTLRTLIRQVYEGHEKRILPAGQNTQAAVLIPLFLKEKKIHVLFTKRTETVRTHKGQIAFPGGARDAEDNDLQYTALRETEEEIGIPGNTVEILAETSPMVTPTQFHVTPFIGIVPYPFDWKINPYETESIIEIPLSHLLDERHHRKGFRMWQDRTYEIHYFDYQEHTVWGVTGFIVYEFLEKLRPHL